MRLFVFSAMMWMLLVTAVKAQGVAPQGTLEVAIHTPHAQE